jgi:hypothetical protein
MGANVGNWEARQAGIFAYRQRAAPPHNFENIQVKLVGPAGTTNVVITK